jgi:tetratricopeptide (TPR) repeat protein
LIARKQSEKAPIHSLLENRQWKPAISASNTITINDQQTISEGLMTSTTPQGFSIELALQQAIDHHQGGRLQEAEQLYRAVLQAQPTHPDANHNLGVLAGQIGRHQAGLPYLKTALESNPLHTQYLLSYANALSAIGQVREAHDALQSGVQHGIQSAELYSNLGNILRQFGQLNDAVQSFSRALELKPEYAIAHFNLGCTLQDLGQLNEAAACFREAIAFHPHFTEAHNNLGVTLRDLGQLEAATASFRDALEFAPEYIDGHYNLGNALRDLGKLEDAVVSYRLCLQINPIMTEAHGNLSNVLRDLGRLDEAALAYESAIAVKADLVDSHYELSALKTYRAGDPHVAIMEQQLGRVADMPMDTRIHYWFALGKMREDLGRYDESFAAYQEANRLRHALLPVDEAADEALLQRMLAVFSAEFFASRAQSALFGENGKAPIFIVGMPRSGTSLLEQILASYPGVYGAGELSDLSEVVTAAMPNADFKHFPEAAAGLSAHDLQRMGEQYMARIWRHAPDAARVTDKMPANFFYIGMIRLMLPNAKIIHAMRDPMDSCFSCYARLFKQGSLNFAYDLQTLGHYYMRYSKMMRHWRQVLPADTVLDLRYEDLVTDTETQARRLLEYLGLPWDDRCLAFHQNRRIVTTASAAQVRKPIYQTSLARWERYREHLGPLFELVKEEHNTYKNL